MATKILGFFAYASSPAEIGQTIEAAVTTANSSTTGQAIHTWKALEIIGHFIAEEVLEGIDNSDFIAADISTLNFNVTWQKKTSVKP